MPDLVLIVFFLSVLLIIHTYVFYPFGMIYFFPNAKLTDEYTTGSVLPEVAVLIAAYNEEKVIKEKIISVFNTTYPRSKIKVYVGIQYIYPE